MGKSKPKESGCFRAFLQVQKQKVPRVHKCGHAQIKDEDTDDSKMITYLLIRFFG
jgi:hypothetical protein